MMTRRSVHRPRPSTAAETGVRGAITLPPAGSEGARLANGAPVRADPRPPSHPAWGVLTLLALAPSIYCVLVLWYRWLRPDPQFLAFSSSIAQLLALASLLGVQTDWGRQVADRFVQAVNQRRHWQVPWRVCLYAWLLAGVLVLALFLSVLVARLYNSRGAAALETGQYSAAATAFRQAVSLAPSNARAHYNLGNAYEELHDFDQAIGEYQHALELDDGLVAAYNNLGRLFVRARHDPDASLLTLLAGLAQVQDPLGRAVLWKNVGQAYLDKELPQAALSSLTEAAAGLETLAQIGVNVSIYQAETYRLTAMVWLSLNRVGEAERAWAACRGHALAVGDSQACVVPSGPKMTDCLNAAIWAAEAREYLIYAAGGG